MNLPNKLTVARVILAPVYLAAMLSNIPHRYLIAVILFMIASVTDFFDGRLARKNNQITVFGKLCDPLADKMLTTAAFLAFMKIGICNIWIVMTILTREFLVTSFRLVASAQGIVIPAGMLGKIKTASQMIFSVFIMFCLEFYDAVGMSFETLAIMSNVLLGITAVLTVASGINYIVNGAKTIDF